MERRGELGSLVGAVLLGLVGTPLLLVMVGWTTDPLVGLGGRLAVFTAVPVIAARVAFGYGFAAGRQSERTRSSNEMPDPEL